jgi:hypothetical protein
MKTKISALGRKRPISASLLCVLTIGLMAMAAPAAQGATQVGQLMPSGAKWLGCLPELNVVQAGVGSGNSYQLPSTGVITRWKFQGVATSSGTASLQVWRRVQNSTFQLVGSSDPEVMKKGLNVFPTQIPAKQGDYLGLHIFTELDACAFNRGEGNKPLGVFGPNPSPRGRLTFERNDSARLNVQAVLEPDTDCDGLGDETQDKAISGGCLPPSAARLVSHKGRGHRGKISLKISCPVLGGNCLSNKLVLRSKKKIDLAGGRPSRLVVGRAKFSLTAGSSKRIRIRLSRKAQRVLSTARLIKAKATIEAKSPIAQPRLSHSTVKIRG